MLDDQKKSNGTVWIILLVVIAICVWAGSAAFIRGLYPDLAESGQFGDMFGAINALFSGVALGGVVVAIFLQRRDLQLQREELRLTREEMKNQREEMAGQKEHLKKQAQTLNAQKFTDTFFSILKLHLESVDKMTGAQRVVGKRLFANIMNEVEVSAKNHMKNTGADEQAAFKHSTKHTLKSHSNQVTPYLERIDLMLHYIESSCPDDPMVFAKAMRSHMSEYEIEFFKLYTSTRECDVSLGNLLDKFSIVRPWQLVPPLAP